LLRYQEDLDPIDIRTNAGYAHQYGKEPFEAVPGNIAAENSEP